MFNMWVATYFPPSGNFVPKLKFPQSQDNHIKYGLTYNQYCRYIIYIGI